MNLRTLTLIAVAVWAPIVADAEADTKIKPEVHRPPVLQKCLSKTQILAQLRKKGYRAARKDMKRQRSAYLITAVRHSRKQVLKVERCSGKILSVQSAREAARVTPDTSAIRRAPKIQLQCLSKTAVHQKLKSGGYGYLKLENIHGPFATSSGKEYRAQTLVKEGPRWCQAKLKVNCYNGNVTDYDTLEDTCIY
ncbi:MAG: hypothetical protein ACLFWF_01810 [Alphaproteobacteria bacterium]